jgi:uncharacterized protein YceH (UPF0502 family)
MHLLCGPVDEERFAAAATQEPRASSRSELADRVDSLEGDVAALRAELEELRRALGSG